MFADMLQPDRNGGIGVAFTDRLDGFSSGPLASLNLGRTDEDRLADLRNNMAAVRSALAIQSVAAVHQVHGVAVFDVDASERRWDADQWLGDRRADGLAELPLPKADALITAQPNIALLVRAADCLPVLFAAGEVIAAAHAGRVGLLAGVLSATVAAIRQRTDASIRAWIGPHICGACYEVPADLAEEVCQTHPAAMSRTAWGSPALDLGAAAVAELTELQVACTRLDPCTKESDRLFSHRGDGPTAGRQGGLIWRS